MLKNLYLFIVLILLTPMHSHSALSLKAQQAEIETLLKNLQKNGPIDTIEDALDRANFTVLGKTIHFNSRYPDWLVKIDQPVERFDHGNIIRYFINHHRLSVPYVPTKILVRARNFNNGPILLLEKVDIHQCDEEVLNFYRTRLTVDEIAQVAFVLLKSGVADTEALENLPSTKNRKRLAFIDTAHRHTTYRGRLNSYREFIRKFTIENQRRFYTINDLGLEDSEIGPILDNIASPSALLTPWAKERAVRF